MTSLIGIAHWDVPRLRGAVGTLDGIAQRLGAWRVRAEDVHGALRGETFWTGPSARSAAESAAGLAMVAGRVATAFAHSLASFHRLLVAADDAQRGAAEALAAAAAVGATLDDGSGAVRHSPPAPTATMAPDQAAAVGADLAVAARASALAVDALAAAAAAASAAEAADAALHAVGVLDAFAPATFHDLEVASVEAFLGTPSVPPPDPGLVARWWTQLPTAEREAAIAADPRLVGGLDGLPVAARDRANRILLAGALTDAGTPEGAHARTVADALARAEAGGQPVQLWSLDLRQGLAAVALGDLDTADDIGILVPGVGSDLGDLGGRLGDAADVATATRQSASVGATVATVAWLGYLAPPTVVAGTVRQYATAGGARLDAALAGLDASRRAGPAPEPRTTVLAHSYGTEVVDVAAGEDGELDADAVALLGSPGMTGRADHLEAPEVYQALAPSDIIRDVGPLAWWDRPFTALTGPLGQLTNTPGYGAVTLPTDEDQAHSDYFEPEHPTLAALGGVVAGTSWR